MYTVEKLLENVCGKDPDDTTEARDFYAAFWGETLSSSRSDYNGTVGNYRGETIISFNTVAGCMIRTLPIYTNKVDFSMPESQRGRLGVIINEKHVKEEMLAKFIQFYIKYHSFANFMPLVYEKWEQKPQINLNKVKGLNNGKYKEFPDLFFKDVKAYYEGDSKILSLPIFANQTNQNYFARFRKTEDEDGWKNFVEKNYLQDFFTDTSYSKFEQLAPVNIKMPYRETTKLSDEQKVRCIEYIDNFLTNAIRIIENRAKRLAMGPVKNITKK